MVECAWSRCVAAAVLAAAVAGGCTTKMMVRQYPPFYDPKLESVAVVEFANDTLRPQAGQFLARRLANKLKANGTYADVLGPKELKTRLFEADLILPPHADANTIAARLRKLGGIQAFITGTVRSFAADRGTYLEIDDYGYGAWGYGRYYRRHWGVMGASFPIYRRYAMAEAHVAAQASLIRVADGKVIHATPGVVGVRVRSTDGPAMLVDEILSQAANAAAERLLATFAIVRRQVKLHKRKDLRTARRLESNELKFTGDFRADEEQMLVVLHLPAAAARNRFRLTVRRKGRHDVLAEEQFTWSAEDTRRVFVFSPRALVAAGGTGDFEVRFHSGERTVLKRKFEIEK